MRKCKLTDEQIKEIVELYLSGEIRNKHELGVKFKTSHTNISKILSDNDVLTTIQESSINKLSYNEVVAQFVQQLLPNHQYVAICKTSGKEFLDYTNISGALSQHLVSIHCDIEIPSSFLRRKFLITNNQFWHEQYFDIIQKPINPVVNIDLTDRDNKIIELYKTSVTSTHKLGEMFKLGHKKIREILINNGVKINKKGGQIKWNDLDKNIVDRFDNELAKTNKRKIAKCKITNKIFNDYANKSGVLTEHIIKLYPNINMPSAYIRNNILAQTQKFWHEEYFDIITVDKELTRLCPYCDWTTQDITNKTGCFENHLTDIHGISIEEHLINFPEDMKLHSNEVKRLEYNTLLLNPENVVQCAICGQKMKSISQTHLNKHDIKVFEYKQKFNDNIICKSQHGEMIVNLNKGRINIKKSFTSKGQVEIFEHLKQHNVNCEINNKKLLNGIEIDIWLPDFKLGIEFNGNLWHSQNFGKKQMNYHLNKTLSMNNLGYQLIHIFEDEWIDNKELVLNKIINMVGVNNSTIIGGRKCIINVIDKEVKSKFLTKYHIQGNDKANLSLGAYFNDELVAVMTFNSKRNMTTNNGINEWELSRFTTNINYKIPGIASKLIKFFIKSYKPSKIFSFGDRRWVLDKDNNLYTKLGFNLISILKPTYFYLHFKKFRNKRLHKFGFGKSSLKKKYPEIYSSDKTEWEMMRQLGYDRIWDCGLFKYELIC